MSATSRASTCSTPSCRWGGHREPRHHHLLRRLPLPQSSLVFQMLLLPLAPEPRMVQARCKLKGYVLSKARSDGLLFWFQQMKERTCKVDGGKEMRAGDCYHGLLSWLPRAAALWPMPASQDVL